jgi:hypothetical protein
MRAPRVRATLCVAALSALSLATPAHAVTSGTFTGTLNGAAYSVRVPAGWNGRLLLYSHGYRQAAGGATSAQDAPDATTATALLAQGYALAGSSYGTNGWAVNSGVASDVALLGWFRTHVGAPSRVYAWGESLGGLVTAMLAQKYPAWSTAPRRCAASWPAPTRTSTSRSTSRSR